MSIIKNLQELERVSRETVLALRDDDGDLESIQVACLIAKRVSRFADYLLDEIQAADLAGK